MKLHILVVVCSVFSCLAVDFASAGAQGEDLDFFEFEKLSLEQSVNVKTDVATYPPSSSRKSPGIITVISRQEIENSGARNLIDVLRLVPGFEFGVDVTGVIGIGFRGIWGQEGKILVLVDGQEYNDLGYAGTQIDRIPIEQVERVEVLRGPGSVMYGGNAEVAVIKITTRGWRDKGERATARYGRTWNGGDDRSLDLHYGGQTSDGLRLSAAAHYSKTERSDRPNTDIAGKTYSMNGESDLASRNANLGLEKGGFHGRLIIDEFDTTQADSFGTSQPRPTQVNSYLYLGEVSYDWKPIGAWTVTPRFNVDHQRPYHERDEFFLYDKTFNRYKEGVTAQYQPVNAASLLLGAELQQDRAAVSDDTPSSSFFAGGNSHIAYDNQAYFAQGQWESPIGTFSGGGRFEHNSAFKDSFVPRLAWTKLWDRLDVKALYSEAFRSPAIENIALNPGIRPEHLTTYEVETGYQLADDWFASLALFNMTIRKTIVYHNDPVTNTEFYRNDGPTGTRGFEVTSRWKRGRHYADASYSFYSATQSQVPLYAVPGHSDALLAWPMHKVAVNASFWLGRGFSLNPSGSFMAERYGFTSQDALGNPVARRLSNIVLLDLFLQKKDAFRKGLDVGVGVYDLFGSNYGFIQPYNSGHAPLPGPSREIALRASYRF